MKFLTFVLVFALIGLGFYRAGVLESQVAPSAQADGDLRGLGYCTLDSFDPGAVAESLTDGELQERLAWVLQCLDGGSLIVGDELNECRAYCREAGPRGTLFRSALLEIVEHPNERRPILLDAVRSLRRMGEGRDVLLGFVAR